VGRLRGALGPMLLLTVAGCSSQVSATAATGGYVSSNGAITVVAPPDRKPAPDVAGPTVDGGHAALGDYAGKTVVLNTWGSWCAPCRAEADDLAAAARQLADADVQFLGLNIRDSQEAARAFEACYDVPYPSIFDPTGAQLLSFPPELAPMAIPTTYVIDADGRVAARILDETTTATLVDLVTEVQESSAGG